MEQEIALHSVRGEEEIMLWKVSQITRKQLSFYFYFTVSAGSRKLSFRRSHEYHKTTPFLFLCVFWGISPSRRRTLGRYYARGTRSILCVPTFPWKYFFFYETREKQGNKKRVVYRRGNSNTRAFSWGSMIIIIPLGSRPLQVPSSLRRTHSYGNLPLQQKDFIFFAEVGLSVYYICTYHCVYHACSLKWLQSNLVVPGFLVCIIHALQ